MAQNQTQTQTQTSNANANAKRAKVAPAPAPVEDDPMVSVGQGVEIVTAPVTHVRMSQVNKLRKRVEDNTLAFAVFAADATVNLWGPTRPKSE